VMKLVAIFCLGQKSFRLCKFESCHLYIRYILLGLYDMPAASRAA
jgi:hypothetical protein